MRAESPELVELQELEGLLGLAESGGCSIPEGFPGELPLPSEILPDGIAGPLGH